jgi:hypothetical protein
MKLRNDNTSDLDSHSLTIGSVNSVLVSSLQSLPMLTFDQESDETLTPIIEEHGEVLSDDHFGTVGFDLFETAHSLEVLTTSGNVTPYNSLFIPMGSIPCVTSSQVTSDC